MSVSDGRPYIPAGGGIAHFKHRRYALKWTREYGRTLFAIPWGGTRIAEHPSYRLVPQTTCCFGINGWRGTCRYHFDVYSIRTGKRLKGERIVCYMVRVHKDDPTIKRPWWNDGRTPFVRDAPWRLEDLGVC